MHVIFAAALHDRVPNFHRFAPIHPDLVPQVAGVTGAGDVDGNAGDRASGHAEILETRNLSLSDFREQPAGGRPLESEGRDLFRNVFNLDVHARGVLAKPAQTRVGGGPAVDILLEAGNSAVVDHLSALVAPACVNHLPSNKASRFSAPSLAILNRVDSVALPTWGIKTT